MQAYCGTTVCAPSRASFFTGLHSGHSPVRGNFAWVPEGQLPLPEETVTIAKVAKAAGYATGTFGKWGMGFFDTTGAPAKQGVERFFGYNCQRLAHSYFPTYLHDNDQPVLLPGNNGRDIGETYAQELIQNELIQVKPTTSPPKIPNCSNAPRKSSPKPTAPTPTGSSPTGPKNKSNSATKEVTPAWVKTIGSHRFDEIARKDGE